MNKNLFQDMVKAKNIKSKAVPAPVVLPPKTKIPLYKKDEAKKSRHALWFVALISIAFLVFSVSVFFSHADVNITPKTKEIDLNTNFTATKSAEDSLPFDTVMLSGQESQKISASGVSDVTIKATGKVIFYNAFSTAPQKLLIDTRLEGSNNKLYKTKTALIIPGMASDGTPGSIEVEIYADIAGVESNAEPLDFKIFGFKDKPKYEKIYGRSKGAITGGFVGTMPKIDDIEKTTTEEALKAALKSKLIGKIMSQLPEGFILFQDAVFFDASPDVLYATSADGSATLSIKGTVYGFIFNKKSLTKAVVQVLAPNEINNVFIPNFNTVSFSLVSKDKESFMESKNITFNLKGNTEIVWNVDDQKILAELVGSSKKNFNTILSKYPNVISADLALRPAWKSTLPEKIDKIHVSVNYPK